MNNNARAILDALTELIETLWNVNQEIDLTQKEVQTELIETLWNVN